MGLYSTYLVPRLVELTCGTKALRRHRRAVCAGLAGEVVEIGFGSGLNVPHYPDAVRVVRAVEPSDLAWRLSEKRRAASPVRIERAGLDGQRLPFADGSADAVLCTWTLCTVPDPAAVLAEVRRVLRPGGRLHLAEHGLAPDPGVAAWQRRLDPFQRRLADGCHLSRPVLDLVRGAGFTPEAVTQDYEPGAPRPFAYLSVGTAVA